MNIIETPVQLAQERGRELPPPELREVVFDVDDTTLTTWDYELFSNWDFNPTTNAQFVGLTGTTFTGNIFPATPGMVELANTPSTEQVKHSRYFTLMPW